MRHNLNLDPHIILTQSRHPNARPNRTMVRHPLLEIRHHSLQRLIVQRNMIRVDPENLLPAFPASVFEVEVHVGKGLLDLSVDFTVVDAGFGIPPAYTKLI